MSCPALPLQLPSRLPSWLDVHTLSRLQARGAAVLAAPETKEGALSKEEEDWQVCSSNTPFKESTPQTKSAVLEKSYTLCPSHGQNAEPSIMHSPWPRTQYNGDKTLTLALFLFLGHNLLRREQWDLAPSTGVAMAATSTAARAERGSCPALPLLPPAPPQIQLDTIHSAGSGQSWQHWPPKQGP